MAEQNPQNLMQNYIIAQNPAAALQFQRQQALAQALLQNADDQMAPNTLANPGGYIIHQSPYLMGAKALEKGIAGYESGKSTALLGALLHNAMNGNNSDANVAAMNANGAGPTVQNAALGKQLLGQSSPNPADNIPYENLQEMAMDQIAPGAGKAHYDARLAWNKPTNEMLNVQNPAVLATMGDKFYTTNASGQRVPISSLPGGSAFVPGGAVNTSVNNTPAPSNNDIPAPQAPPAPSATVNNIPSIPEIPQAQPAAAGATPPPAPNMALGGKVDMNNPVDVAGAKANVEKNAENLAEAQKTYAVATSNLPRALERFQEAREAAQNASSGIMAESDDADNGPGAALARTWIGGQIEPKTAAANQKLEQVMNQGVISEMGPMLAGMRPNKFMEGIVSGATAINPKDNPADRVTAINGLQDQFIAGIKAAAAQRRSYGEKGVPTDEQIDQMIADAKTKIKGNQNGATHIYVPGQGVSAIGGQ